MRELNPIVIIDDDKVDLDVFTEVLVQLKVRNRICGFTSGKEFLDYLKTAPEKPAIVFCSFHLSDINVFELKRKQHESNDCKKEFFPFVFLADTFDPVDLDRIYKSNCQGFFIKAASFDAVKNLFSLVLSYWKLAVYPGSY